MQTRRTFLASLAGASAFALTACGGSSSSDSGSSTAAASGDGTDAKGEGIMTYDEYMAVPVDEPVAIEAFVQGKQSWWENAATLYLQDADGGYFAYNAACSEEDFDKLVEGQKVKLEGYKANFEGEIEIVDANVVIEEGNFIAEPTDVTDLLGSDDLINYQNYKVAYTGLEIAASDNGEAFAYKGDAAGDDIYFKAKLGDDVYDFTIEAYLTDAESDVYKTVESLKVGDVVDMVGFLYWYQGANPHITSVTVK